MSDMGFDSESDRRDAVRSKAVQHCVAEVLRLIGTYAVTESRHEKTYLQLAVIHALMRGVKLEAMSFMMRDEINAAEQEIEKT